MHPGCQGNCFKVTALILGNLAVIIAAVAVCFTAIVLNIKQVRLWFMRKIEEFIQRMWD